MTFILFLIHFHFKTLHYNICKCPIRPLKPVNVDFPQPVALLLNHVYYKEKKNYSVFKCFTIQMENENKIRLMMKPVNWDRTKE